MTGLKGKPFQTSYPWDTNLTATCSYEEEKEHEHNIMDEALSVAETEEQKEAVKYCLFFHRLGCICWRKWYLTREVYLKGLDGLLSGLYTIIDGKVRCVETVFGDDNHIMLHFSDSSVYYIKDAKDSYFMYEEAGEEMKECRSLFCKKENMTQPAICFVDPSRSSAYYYLKEIEHRLTLSPPPSEASSSEALQFMNNLASRGTTIIACAVPPGSKMVNSTIKNTKTVGMSFTIKK